MPLEHDLDVARETDGSVQVLDGDALVAEGRSVPGFHVEVPAPATWTRQA